MKFFLLLFISFFTLNIAFSQSLDDAKLGFIVTDLNSGITISSKNAEMLFTPASVTKLITTATALELLGGDFKFSTNIKIKGKIKNNKLYGSLIIKAGGDPTLGSRYFENSDFFRILCDTLKNKGIKEITDGILADVSIFDDKPLPKHWTAPDLGNYYAAGVYGLSFCDNTLNVIFNSKKTGTKPQIIDMHPKIDGIKIDNQLISKKGVGDNAYFGGLPYNNNRKVTGCIESNSPRFTVKADIGNPPLVLIRAIRDSLIKNGISLKGSLEISYEQRDDSAKETNILSLWSPPLSDIIKNTNTYSNNMFAEYIFKYLSSETNQQGTFDNSIKKVTLFWKKQKEGTSEIDIYDGSGLSSTNRITPKFLNDILIYMYKNSSYSSVFFNSLPIAGNNGTVKNFLKNTPLEGKAFLKSGSMKNVQCYAGYIILPPKNYSIVVMVNDFAGNRKNIVQQIERLIMNIVEAK